MQQVAHDRFSNFALTRWKLVRSVLALVVVAATGWGQEAGAALTFYTTRTGLGSFDSAFPGAPIEDFEGPANGFHQISPPLSAAGAGPYGLGDILAGLEFTTSSGAANSLAAQNTYGPPTISLFNQEGGNTTTRLIINFTTPVVAAGMDVFIIFGLGIPDVEVFVYSGVAGATFEGSTTLTSLTTGASTPRFTGVSSTIPITRITLRGYTNSNDRIEGIDNLAFVQFSASAVPEPSTFALAIVPLAALMWYGWRRRK